MNGKELDAYKRLNNDQKKMVDILKELGFKHEYFNTYVKSGWGQIELKSWFTWKDFMMKIYEAGANEARFNIQRALGL